MGVNDDGKMIVIGYQLFSRQCDNGENTCVGLVEKLGACGMTRARDLCRMGGRSQTSCRPASMISNIIKCLTKLKLVCTRPINEIARR